MSQLWNRRDFTPRTKNSLGRSVGINKFVHLSTPSWRAGVGVVPAINYEVSDDGFRISGILEGKDFRLVHGDLRNSGYTAALWFFDIGYRVRTEVVELI